MGDEFVEFNTIREDFSEYQAENGQILKIKSTVTSIINTEVDNKKQAKMSLQIVSAVATPIPIDTSKLQLADPNQVTEKDQVGELKFTIVKEIVNIYETKNLMILAIPHMQKVFKTNKKDVDNNPILRFTFTSDLNILNKTGLPPNTPIGTV
jgi:hypothetical protein